MMAHAALAAMLLVAAPGGHGKAPASGYVPAPVPDASFDVPGPRTQPRVEVVPGLTDTRGYVPLGGAYSPGSAYDNELARRSQHWTAIGNRLAPGLMLRIPLK